MAEKEEYGPDNPHPNYKSFVSGLRNGASNTVKDEKTGIETGYSENGDVAYTLDAEGKITIYWDKEGKKPALECYPNGADAQYREDGTLFHTTSHDGTGSYYVNGKLHHSVDSEGNVTYGDGKNSATKNAMKNSETKKKETGAKLTNTGSKKTKKKTNENTKETVTFVDKFKLINIGVNRGR